MTKDPDAVRDYTWDWTADLDESDTITEHEIANVVGVTVGAHAVVDGTKVVARISGGTVGEPASATCHIVTASGQQDDRTMRFTITNR